MTLQRVISPFVGGEALSKLRTWCAAVAGLAILAVGNAALAVPPPNAIGAGNPQSRFAQRRPTVSPYLGLTIGGGVSPVINYYNVVRPLQQQQELNYQREVEIDRLQQRVTDETAPAGPYSRRTIRSTGSRAWYMTHDRYFGQQLNRSPAGGAPTR